MPKGIPQLYAYAIQRGAHVIPQIHTTLCNPSCVFFADCANYEQNQPCVGFKLAENDSTRQILANLNENDKVFVERCLEDIPKVQDPQYQEILVKEVLRYIEPEEKIKRITRVYDGDKLYSVKEEQLKSLEQPEHVNVSLFGDWHVSSDRIKKPNPAPSEPPKLETEEPTTMNIRRGLAETHRKTTYPEICDETCPHRTCPYYKFENFGKKCLQQPTEQNR
jgi:hypothetical protein